jgi:hypothetical protein
MRTLNTVGKMTEILPCEVEQLVGIAVTRRQRIAQTVVRRVICLIGVDLNSD